MTIMDKIAPATSSACCCRKTLQGINGSGKHNNWSLERTGVFPARSGQDRWENLQFITFLVNAIRPFTDWRSLLKASIMTRRTLTS